MTDGMVSDECKKSSVIVCGTVEEMVPAKHSSTRAHQPICSTQLAAHGLCGERISRPNFGLRTQELPQLLRRGVVADCMSA